MSDLYQVCDAAILAAETFERAIADHPAVKADPVLSLMAEALVDLLNGFYQQVGHHALAAEEAADVASTKNSGTVH